MLRAPHWFVCDVQCSTRYHNLDVGGGTIAHVACLFSCAGALNKFKAGQRNILVATDVASRGLDIPNVDMVLNFDIPSHGKDYIHRVGRTARAGKSGRSVSFVTQYDVEAYQRLETLIEQKLPEVSCLCHVCVETSLGGGSWDVLLLRTTSGNLYHVLWPSVLSAVTPCVPTDLTFLTLGMKSSATWSLLGYGYACCDVCGSAVSLIRVLCALFPC
jgi:hypothetical protein